MNVTRVETRFGRIPVWYDGGSTSARRLVLVIRGVFPPPNQYEDLEPADCDLALLHLPGFHSPLFPRPSIDAFAEAFDEVIRQLFRDRDITVVGVSTGCLPALSLLAPEVRRLLLVEPFTSTAKLWPLIEMVQATLKTEDQPALHSLMWEVFGYGPDRVVDRDYRSLFTARSRPTHALVGDVPLNPRRPVYGLPSLTDEGDRELLGPKVVPGGHDVPLAAIRAALGALHARFP